MLEKSAALQAALTPLIEKIVDQRCRNVLRAERYDVVTPPDGTKIGVRQPFGKSEIFLPYAQSVANAQEGDAVLVLWRGSLSTAIVWCYGAGPI